MTLDHVLYEIQFIHDYTYRYVVDVVYFIGNFDGLKKLLFSSETNNISNTTASFLHLRRLLYTTFLFHDDLSYFVASLLHIYSLPLVLLPYIRFVTTILALLRPPSPSSSLYRVALRKQGKIREVRFMDISSGDGE